MARAKTTTPAKKPQTRTVRSPARKAAERPDMPILEWVAAGVGLVLTLLVVGVIAWEALGAERGPPAMAVSLRAVSAVQGGYVAEIELANTGGRPAAEVVVEGVLSPPAGAPETSDVTFDYIADQSRRSGGLFFKADPRRGALTLQARGFVEP